VPWEKRNASKVFVWKLEANRLLARHVSKCESSKYSMVLEEIVWHGVG